MLPFDLSDKKKELLETDGHLLVLGGPGSGKTTIALLKAQKIIESKRLRKSQRILFLSFARATVTRVAQQAKNIKIIKDHERRSLEINTYHGFTWNILKAHGYLLNAGKSLRLLTPPDAASRLADLKAEQKEDEKRRLFDAEGLVHFDLFATLAAELLEESRAIRKLISSAYPIIILDEFQDTDPAEWRFVQRLGEQSTIIALADLDQRIYEFRGADPARVADFIKAFKPTEFDFEMENNRSNGTDIAKFGNDLLTGVNKKTSYKDVYLKRYRYAKGSGEHIAFKAEVMEAAKRLRKSGNSQWSLGILVPSKKLMLSVSDFLLSKQNIRGSILNPIAHDVALEMAGPSLSAVLISKLMEKGVSTRDIQNTLLSNLCDHMRGRNGADGPSQANLTLSNALREFIATGNIRGSKRKAIVEETMRIAEITISLKFTGDPVSDWILVRKVLEKSDVDSIKQVGIDAQYLRLLRKGAILGSELSNLWRVNGDYHGAGTLIRTALAQEHFSSVTTTWKGIHVMTIHKAKGKEFDEVIIYEGTYWGRILRQGASPKDTEQSRLALRVAVTRAMKRTTIITPSGDPCPFLL